MDSVPWDGVFGGDSWLQEEEEQFPPQIFGESTWNWDGCKVRHSGAPKHVAFEKGRADAFVWEKMVRCGAGEFLCLP